MKIIDPSDIHQISCLQKQEIAVPKIEFEDQNLQRTKTTLKAAFSIITRDNQLEQFFTELDWNINGDINWQNQMLNTLSQQIFLMIRQWRASIKSDDELLIKIFLFIQLWGGNTSRGFFIKNGGFEGNFNLETYKAGVSKAISKNPDSLTSLLKLNQMGISFATKHMFFWSDKKLPIYDNIIAMIIFGRSPENKINHYKQYVDLLMQLEEINKEETHIIERSIFNWADTDNGKNWFKIRKESHKKKN